MVQSYFGQRHVEVAALDASFELVRARMEGQDDPQTPREPIQVRLHMPDWHPIQKKKTQKTASAGEDCSSQKEARTSQMASTEQASISQVEAALDAAHLSPGAPRPQQCQEDLPADLNELRDKVIAMPSNSESSSPDNRQCAIDAIYLAGFGSEFQQLPPEEGLTMVAELTSGLFTRIKDALFVNGIVAQARHDEPSDMLRGFQQATANPGSSCFEPPSSSDSSFTQQPAHERQPTQAHPQRPRKWQEWQRRQPIGRLNEPLGDAAHATPPSGFKPSIRIPMPRLSSRGAPSPEAYVTGQHASEGQLPPMVGSAYQRLRQPHFSGYPRGLDAEQPRPVRTCPDLPSFHPATSEILEGKGSAKGSKWLQDASMGHVSAQSTQVNSLESLPSHCFFHQVNTMDSLPSDWSQPSHQVNTVDSLPYLPDVLENEEEDFISTESSGINKQWQSPHAVLKTMHAMDLQRMEQMPVPQRPSNDLALCRNRLAEVDFAATCGLPNLPPGLPLPEGVANAGAPVNPPLPFRLLKPTSLDCAH